MENKDKVVIKCRGIIYHNNKILIAKHGKDADFYAFLGGHLEGSENPKECIEREIYEELGIKPEIGKLLYVNNYIEKDGTHYVEFFFEIKNNSDYIYIEKFNGVLKDELSDIMWIGKNENIKILPEKIYTDFNNDIMFSNDVQFVS